MKNKINKKTLIFIIITTVISVSFFSFILNYQYRSYTKNYNESINSIIYEITLKYPDINEYDLIEVLDSNKNSDDILSKYGINDKNSSIIENDKLFKKYIIIDLLVLVVIILVIYLFFIINKFKRTKKINKIIELISKINRRNFAIDIEDYTEDELSALKQEIYKTSLMLRSGDKNATINCDFMWEVEAISNIIKNSIEHINSDGFVEINYTKNKVYSRILIRDNGIGIDSDDLPYIFDRFYKGKNTSRDSVGIGLALSKSIIEKDNGSVSVKSTPNIGTIFTIKFFE